MFQNVRLFCIFLLIKYTICHHDHNHDHQSDDDQQNHLLTTSSGSIMGTILKTRLNKTIYAFRGIEYAKAKRFEPSKLIESWDGIYNATEDGPNCPQPGFEPKAEDCLFLNVYTKTLPTQSQNPKIPVVIFLHPGAFYAFTGRSDWAGPQYFMDQNIVLVTLNYRVASLGFISTGQDAPGNNGLKDQVQAMRWVQKNIAAFGGDPNSVTLFGYSAGAWSIVLHMVSPMSQGLFHKGILGSGSSVGIWPLPKNQLDTAKQQARILKCPDDTPAHILECLKTKSSQELGDSLLKFSYDGFGLPLTFSPVIEEDYGQERFLLEDPVESYKKGNFMKIPILGGITEKEFGYAAKYIMRNATLVDQLDKHFETIAPIIFVYERNTEKSKKVSQKIREFYLKDSINEEGLSKIFADAVVGFPVYRIMKLISIHCNEPEYYYQFTYPGRYSFNYLPNKKTDGVVHHDDLIYLFFISLRFPYFQPDDPEIEMVEKLTLLWANFATTGNPIPKTTKQLDGVSWEPFNIQTKKYLEIGKKLILKERLYEDRYNFWEQLYP